MMACVAKHVDAVHVLLTGLEANASYGNANGMTALMCAARLSLDPAQEDPEVLMAASSAILKLLLACEGIHVNASELTGGNTALHFAVLSRNVRGVQVLVAESELNIELKSKAGLTPVELGVKIHASRELMACLLKRSTDAELRAVEKSRELAMELMASELKESGKKATKKKKAATGSKDKKSGGNHESGQVETVVAEPIPEAHRDDDPMKDEEEEASPALSTRDCSTMRAEPLVDTAALDQEDQDVEDWQQVATKKNRK